MKLVLYIYQQDRSLEVASVLYLDKHLYSLVFSKSILFKMTCVLRTKNPSNYGIWICFHRCQFNIVLCLVQCWLISVNLSSHSSRFQSPLSGPWFQAGSLSKNLCECRWKIEGRYWTGIGPRTVTNFAIIILLYYFLSICFFSSCDLYLVFVWTLAESLGFPKTQNSE